MKLFIYHNELCDPQRNIGTAKQFTLASDVDAFINFFVASMAPKAMPNYRIFVTNDEVDFVEVDHFVLMDEPMGFMDNVVKIKEINIYEIAKEVNTEYQAIHARREKDMEDAKKGVADITDALKEGSITSEEVLEAITGTEGGGSSG